MTKFKDFISLIRVKQWYKNLVVFLPIIFLGNLFDINSFLLVFVGFISLSLMSSVNYVINDIFDVHKDKEHLEKKNRPLASGRIKIFEAIILGAILFFMAIFIGSFLPFKFLLSILFLFLLTLFYSLYLKKEPFLDILVIAVNFVTRAIAGSFILKAEISPWLILCPFFLSLFLSVGKREADLKFLGEEAYKYRNTLKYYTKELTNALMIISTTSLIISYSLFSFLSNFHNLLYTLPFALYVIFRYFYFVYSGNVIARHPEKVIKDKRIIFGILLWTLSILVVIYLV